MARVPELGELIADRYRIQAQAREGPGYVTLHAFDREVEVEVSVLWFRAGLFPDAGARQGFLGDGVTIRGLTHPHLRRVYEASIYNENAFATAQVGSAAAVVKRLGSHRPADELDVIRYASAIGEGLEAAHRLGLIHGYLVPSDIVEVKGQIKVTGVGLYHAASRDVARDLFWTRRRYLAPEVVAGGEPTVRSDVFSMAAVLSEIASGVSGNDIAEALAATSRAHPRLRDVLTRALDEHPEQRHASVGAVLDQVRRHLIDDRVPTAEQPPLKALADPDTSRAIVIEAEEPPESMTRRPTTQRPIVTRKLLEDDGFDPSPISLLHADGDPMAVSGDDAAFEPGDSSPWSRGGDDEPDEITVARESSEKNAHIGDMTVEIDFQSKTREYRLSDSVPADEDEDEDDPPLELTSPLSARALVPSFDETLPRPAPRVPRGSPTPPRPMAPGPMAPGSPRSPDRAAPTSTPAPTAMPTPVPKPTAAPERLPSAELAAPPEPFSAAVDPSPPTLRAMPPPPSGPVFVSQRPAGEPASQPTPLIPALERPGMKPVLKPISAGVPRPPPASLGNYAPPRDPSPPPRRSKATRWLWAAVATLVVVLGGLLALIVMRENRRANEASEKPAAVIDAGARAAPIDAAPVVADAFVGPCSAQMVHARPENEVAFCIDKYEAAPAEGELPQTEVTLADAEAACAVRGARLCSSAEWIAGCRGPEQASYPYGRRYVVDACNASVSRRRDVEAGGNYPECESAAGAFDMSGNVAEWTADGFIQGGSANDLSGGRCSKRYRRNATRGYKDVGYRCCADPLAVD